MSGDFELGMTLGVNAWLSPYKARSVGLAMSLLMENYCHVREE